jgi:hypothetical protein
MRNSATRKATGAAEEEDGGAFGPEGPAGCAHPPHYAVTRPASLRLQCSPVLASLLSGRCPSYLLLATGIGMNQLSLQDTDGGCQW